MSDECFSPETFYGYISKIDPNDIEIRKVENAGFFRLATMLPEIPRHIYDDDDIEKTAIAILGFEVSGDFEIMAAMKADLIEFMESSDLKKYFNPKPTIFSGFYWDIELGDEEESEEDESEEDESEEDESEEDYDTYADQDNNAT